MKAKNVVMGLAAGAAVGAAALMTARNMGLISNRQIRAQAKRAVKAMENMTDSM